LLNDLLQSEVKFINWELEAKINKRKQPK